MAIHPSSKLANIKRSVEKWFNDQFSSSYSIDFEGVPFNGADKSEWLQPRILIGGRMFHRQVGEGYLGDTTEVIINVNIFVRRSMMKAADRPYRIRDDLFSKMKVGTMITVYDYVGDSSVAAYLKSREIVDDFLVKSPEAEDIIGYNFSVLYNYLSKY
ncbi:MAG: hypothetical protein DRI01_00575 [Chloroflexi bacterium]|nr:MAG: hypothetical protein DRI01_00575 [Chloroflexota bacterium]